MYPCLRQKMLNVGIYCFLDGLRDGVKTPNDLHSTVSGIGNAPVLVLQSFFLWVFSRVSIDLNRFTQGGCPNAPLPVCAFCPDDLSPEYEDILLPPFYNQTCADIRDVAPFYITNETCAAFLDDFPVQPECLCDCGAVDPIPEEENCRLCGNETVSFPSMMVQIDEANVLVSLSCAEVGRLAQCAKEANFCADLVENFYSPCCLGIPNTPSPTQSPGDQVSPMPTSTPATSDDSLGRWQVSWLCPLLLTMLIWNVL